jgi:hypothetical protein
MNVNDFSRHCGGVYYQDGFAYLETHPHQPNGPPGKSFADFASKYTYRKGMDRGAGGCGMIDH